jgi:hypothetical protein
MIIVVLSCAETQHINFHYWENPLESLCLNGKVHSLLSKLSCTIIIHATAFEICYFRKCRNWCWSCSPWECYKGKRESAVMGLWVMNHGTRWRWPFSFTKQLKQTHPLAQEGAKIIPQFASNPAYWRAIPKTMLSSQWAFVKTLQIIH